MRCIPPARPRLVVPLLVLLLAAGCGANATHGATRRGSGSGRAPATIPPGSQASGSAVLPPLPADRTLLTLVTKTRGFTPPNYVPPDLEPVPPEFNASAQVQQLRKPAIDALVQMLTDARNEGLGIKVLSGYRSFEYQDAVFRGEVADYGCTQAVSESALPGHSEHQLGLAADLTAADMGWDLQNSFAQKPEGRWLAQHAATYGFVLSYPEGKESATGYIYEPWHYRYVTPPVARAIATSGKTPTEYLLSLGPLADSNIVTTPAAVPTKYGCG